MNCPLCSEINIGRIPYDYDVDISDRVLADSENTMLLVDICPIVNGHVLLISKIHYLCIGAIPNRQRTEFEYILNTAIANVEKQYGKTTIVEHGSCHSGNDASCIEHAHLHIIPGEYDFMESSSRFKIKEVNDMWEISSMYLVDKPYVYIKSKGKQYLVSEIDGIEKQFARRVVGKHLGMQDEQWDWRSMNNRKYLYETYEILKNNWNK
jgi:diadenosine tetraphosphate (Ap4A) HIT family hydrolase